MINLLRLEHPDDQNAPWRVHSLINVAADRPDLYTLSEFRGYRTSTHDAMLLWMAPPRLDRIRWALNQFPVRNLLKGGVPLIIDDSGEPGFGLADEWRQLRDAIANVRLPAGRIILVMQNERGASEARKWFAGGAVTVEATPVHYWMHRLRTDFTPRRNGSVRTHRYACLNYKMRPHRAAVLGWLKRQGFLDRGLVSMSVAPDVPAMLAASGSRLPSHLDCIKDADDLDLPTRVGARGGLCEQVPFDVHDATGFSFVMETDFGGADMLRFTEKALKPLAAGQPFIVAGGYRTLALLRQYGFKTFSPVIDERYDEIADPDKRLTALLAEANRLITMPEPEFDALLDELKPIIAHNVAHFLHGLSSVMDGQHKALSDFVKQPAFA